MRRYIRPPSLVVEQGRKLGSKLSWKEAKKLLKSDESEEPVEELAVVIRGARGMLALHTTNEKEFIAANHDPDITDIYAIGKALASKAST